MTKKDLQGKSVILQEINCLMNNLIICLVSKLPEMFSFLQDFFNSVM